MNDLAKEFVLAEFDALRREIESAIRHVHSLVPLALVTCGAMWTWLFTKRAEVPSPHVGWIPMLLAAFIFFRNLAMDADIRRVGDYISTVESKMGLPAGLGWETKLRAGRWHGASGLWQYAFWAAFLTGNIILAIGLGRIVP